MSKRKLRVFEAFAGIGAQASALSRMNIDYEIVGISDWYVDAIECYAAIHCSNIKVDMPEDIKEIVDEHLLKGRIVKRLLYSETVEEDNVKSLNETNFYKKQHRVALRNCGVINPENID